MTRRRWLVVLGPPLLFAAAAVPMLGGRDGVRVGATSLAPPRPMRACPPDTGAPAAPVAAPAAARGAPGSWWHLTPSLDPAGTLTGWGLEVGAPGARRATLALPAATTVTGPAGGRVVAASEGATSSRIRIIDTAAGCATTVEVPDRVVRRALLDPAGPGVIAHLLEPMSRRDLGIWRIDPRGTVVARLVEPPSAILLAEAGLDRVWVTDLRLDPPGRRLAVQSCDPDGCLTRVVDLASGRVRDLVTEDQGPILALGESEVIGWATCHGYPCPVMAWDVELGTARRLVAGAGSAAVSADGRTLVVRIRGGDGTDRLEVIDLATGRTRSLPVPATGGRLLDGGAAMIAGLEAGPGTIAVGDARGMPSAIQFEEVRP